MIALNCCARPMQLDEARQNLQRRNRHGCAPFFATQLKGTNERPVYAKQLSVGGAYTFSITTATWRPLVKVCSVDMKQYVPIGSWADVTPASQRRQSEIK